MCRFANTSAEKHCSRPLVLNVSLGCSYLGYRDVQCADLLVQCADLLVKCADLLVQCADLLVKCADLLVQCTDSLVKCADLLVQCADLLVQCADLLVQCADLLILLQHNIGISEFLVQICLMNLINKSIDKYPNNEHCIKMVNN